MASRKKARRLTPKEEHFCRLIVEGRNPSEAYRSAYDTKANGRVIAVAAQRILKRGLVSAKIKALQVRTESELTLTRTIKREILARMILSSVVIVDQGKRVSSAKLTSDQLKAMEIDNKMAGHNEAEKMDVNVGGRLLQRIRSRAKKP